MAQKLKEKRGVPFAWSHSHHCLVPGSAPLLHPPARPTAQGQPLPVESTGAAQPASLSAPFPKLFRNLAEAQQAVATDSWHPSDFDGGAVPRVRPCEKETALAPILLCAFCNASFTSSGGLSLHKASVHFNRKFVCNICGKTFTRKENLSRHHISAHGKPPENV
ncbi:hypothetical protein ACOMHN_059015 [Nucella lapillus]